MVLVRSQADSDNLKKSKELQEENNKLIKSIAKNKKRGLIIGSLGIGASVLVYFLGFIL